ncbi:MAG: HAD family hydrolase [Flavobacteriaceae bacterium]|nr:HAD family hydrolase [Flavobacteriaceae bacterium]
MKNRKIAGILWDYDGTLVNSALKNIDITKQIILEVCPRLSGENLPIYLSSEKDYHFANHKANNWQDLYLNYYKMTYDEMISAGKLWTKYQLKNNTPVYPFSQIIETVREIDLPQGICSQNSSKNILETLETNDLSNKFDAIIGYDDIPNDKQKPSSFGGVKCLNQIFDTIENKIIIYVGDHEGDVEFARNIGKELGRTIILSVGVKYSGADIDSWNFKPDYEIEKPNDLIDIIKNYS